MHFRETSSGVVNHHVIFDIGGSCSLNVRILFKSFKLAFRAKKRVFAFIIIYAILYILVGKTVMGSTLEESLPYLFMAGIVATVYAVLISQFRRRDIAILKCVSWANAEIIILLIGEVVIVAATAFLVVFQASVEILGLAQYFLTPEDSILAQLEDMIVIQPGPMFVTLFYIIILQLPGLVLAQWRATRIPPMRALREE